ncbi:FkbM family methyltransferase [Thiovibrio frasassiensis]|uniref:FkbM family methyltransferase n=1 Tax=Thiovibrio frasassiensis TaxID=2984131 RepID=A0A9X4MNR4_9BACT|nr:FkbM family methyltransferase [Thiovibrio frasassiensis]MDG4476042.1 FkbM family methyltransferase [Thiovibrio frasassiensis]
MMVSKRIMKDIFRRLGLEVHRYTASVSPTAQIVSSLHKFGIDLILDVGANQGQFASEIRGGGYRGNIISFEPLSEAHSVLRRVSQRDAKWYVHPRCALGDYNGEVNINIAGNSVSSSILPMLDAHQRAAPASIYQGREVVPLQTLDAVSGDYLVNAHKSFLKIDTQGFEWQVLDGARDTLPYIRGVLLELSLVPLYEGQHLWREIIDRLETEGFVLWSLLPGFTDPVDGQTLQVDAVFYRQP